MTIVDPCLEGIKEPLNNSWREQIVLRNHPVRGAIARNAPGRLLSRKRDSPCSRLLRRFAMKKWVIWCRKMPCPSLDDVAPRFLKVKRVFDLVKDFGTSESPKSTRSSTTHWCPGRPGHPAFRHNIASSLRLHTGLPYDWTPRSDAPLGSPLAPSARRVSRVASRLPGTTRLRFALHGGPGPHHLIR